MYDGTFAILRVQTDVFCRLSVTYQAVSIYTTLSKCHTHMREGENILHLDKITK